MWGGRMRRLEVMCSDYIHLNKVRAEKLEVMYTFYYHLLKVGPVRLDTVVRLDETGRLAKIGD